MTVSTPRVFSAAPAAERTSPSCAAALLAVLLAAAPAHPASAQQTGFGPDLPAAQDEGPQQSGPRLPPGQDAPSPGYNDITNAQPAAGYDAPRSQSLGDALAEVYLTEPQLLAARARLRATDENVPAALSGWRPQISYSVQPAFGFGTITNRNSSRNFLTGQVTNTDVTSANSRYVYSQQATITQPIWRGGRTVAATAQAENQVRAERANLIAQEEQSFANAVSAFVGLIEDQQLYQLQVNNVTVTQKQLEATNARFGVGEITRTDVAQAQAALAQAIAQRETAYGTLQTAIATYRSAIGPVPKRLVDPQPLALPFKTLSEAQNLAAINNAAVISAAYNDAVAKDQVDAAYANLMPQVSVQANAFYNQQANLRGIEQRGGQVGLAVTAPIYQGGSEYAAIRQAKQNEQQNRKQLDSARKTAIQQVTQYWENYVAAKATVASTRVQVRADEIALDGVEREALAGTQTTQDVLYQQQQLLAAEVSLVQNLAAMVGDSYQLAGAIGRLTARDLALKVPLYDEKAYYNAVRLLPFGTGDKATDQPGR